MTPVEKATGRAEARQALEDDFVIPAALRRRFRAAAQADKLELEQAILRIVIYLIVYAYVVVVFLWDGAITDAESPFILAVGSVFPLTFVPLAWCLLRPGVNLPRRWFGIVLDIATATAGLVLTEESGAVLYGVYLWITIGNGFRFGLRYLYISQMLALAGFTLVLLVNPFWRAHGALGTALLVVLAAVPAYLGVLVARFHTANRRLQEARGEAEAANVAKTKFLAAASHDLRQPMQALSMYASVLEQRTADGDALRVVRGIQLSVTTLEQMFDSLLDIARIESGVVRARVVAFPLLPLMERVAGAEQPLAAQKGLELRVVPTAATVASDPVLLERILKNLVTNAIRYTERGGIVVGCRRASALRLRLEVVDTGQGIATQERERIFDEYYQIGGRSAQGLGLGLSIVRSLAELLEHDVGVRSTPGRGSAFWIELGRLSALPAALPEASPGAAPALAGAAGAVVAPDAACRRSINLLLESWGCRNLGGATAAAVEAQLRAAPDALIVDYRLAGAADGLQAIARLRGAFGASIPALLITGTPSGELIEQARAAGVTVAQKPVPPGKIRAFLVQATRASS
jgi:signal transduction histidine kinase/CheY-like chemotaxis protein